MSVPPQSQPSPQPCSGVETNSEPALERSKPTRTTSDARRTSPPAIAAEGDLTWETDNMIRQAWWEVTGVWPGPHPDAPAPTEDDDWIPAEPMTDTSSGASAATGD